MTQQAHTEPLALLLAKWLQESPSEANSWSDMAATELHRLHEENEQLHKLIIDAEFRCADQRLRADQMSQQHDSQAALNREARHKLAQLTTQQAEVQMPEPVATVTNTTPRVAGWHTMFVPEAGTKLYTEQQVRSLLATNEQTQAPMQCVE